MLFCGTSYAQTTFDFNNDYAKLFPTLAGTSSNDSHDGDFTEATTSEAINGITVTVSAKTSGDNNNRIWNKAPRLRLYTGTLTIDAMEGQTITGIDFDYSNSGKWNDKNKVNTGELANAGNKVTWTGSSSSVVVSIAGNTQLNSLTVYVNGGAPEPVTMVEYEKATKVESGKQYLIVAEENGTSHVANPLTSNYGYLNITDYKVTADGTLELPEDAGCDFTITETDGGYTIMQPDGRYLYQTGTYDSFNVNANPENGDVWSFVANADGTFTITNNSVNKYVQYSSQYSSFGSYANERGILPVLYVKKTTSSGINNITVEQELDENAPVYNLSGQRVSKDTKGILIQNGKKFINR